MSALTRSLKQYDEEIAFWEDICKRYPESVVYQINLVRLKTLRDLKAATIGR